MAKKRLSAKKAPSNVQKTSIESVIILDGTTSFTVATTTTLYTNNKKTNETTTQKIYPLCEIGVDELLKHRRNKDSGFVLKSNDSYYYTSIPKDLRLQKLTTIPPMKHMCSKCNRLSAAEDCDGGCVKVRKYSKCIERFDFIPFGFETFNTVQNVFVVWDCKHYEIYPESSPKMSIEELTNTKLELARFVWEDVNSLTEVRRRIKRNTEL